jgi:peroxiredoxin
MTMKTPIFLAGAALLAALAISPLGARVGADEAPAPQAPLPAAKDFALKDVTGKEHKLADHRKKWVVLEWTNLQCPFVMKHYAAPARHMQSLQKRYAEKGVVWLTICSSAEGKQGHLTPDGWKQAMATHGMAPTAVLLDADGKVGKAYGAKTTPEIWVIDPEGRIAYHGAADAEKDPRADVTKVRNYIVETLDAVLAGKAPEIRETTPYGCSVKYAP